MLCSGSFPACSDDEEDTWVIIVAYNSHIDFFAVPSTKLRVTASSVGHTASTECELPSLPYRVKVYIYRLFAKA